MKQRAKESFSIYDFRATRLLRCLIECLTDLVIDCLTALCCLIMLRHSLCDQVIVWPTHNRLLQMARFSAVLPSFVLPRMSYFRKLASFASSILPTIHLVVVIHQSCLFDIFCNSCCCIYTLLFLCFFLVTVCAGNAYLFFFRCIWCWFNLTLLTAFCSWNCLHCIISLSDLFLRATWSCSVLLATAPATVVPCHIFWHICLIFNFFCQWFSIFCLSPCHPPLL